MSNKIMKPLSVAVGVAFVGSLAISQAATASSFSLVDMDQGYQLAGDPAAEKAKEEGKCGEGKCGAEKAKHEGKCGEGKCGADKAKHEGKCGEGKCGADKLDADKDGAVSATEFAASGHDAAKFTSMDTDKSGGLSPAEFDAAHAAKHAEGKCGEGKCGEGKEKKEGSCGGSR